MNKNMIAGRLLKIAKILVAAETLQDYVGDNEGLADELEGLIDINSGSEVNGDEIFFYEAETKKGIPVNIQISINPRNQPERTGKTKIGIVIENNYEAFGFDEDEEFAEYAESVGSTLEDGIWQFKNTDKLRSVAKDLTRAINKVLNRW